MRAARLQAMIRDLQAPRLLFLTLILQAIDLQVVQCGMIS